MQGWFWLGISILCGVVIAVFQRWTAQQVHPENHKRAGFLVIGGAYLRWLICAGLLVAAINSNPMYGIICAAGLLVTRWVLLLRFTGVKIQKKPR